MKQLLEDYRRRLRILMEELNIVIKEGSDIITIIRLTIKGSCYRIFIAELERLIPADKPIDPKIIAEAERIKKIKEDEVQKELDEWNRRMEAGEFEPKEDTQPEM